MIRSRRAPRALTVGLLGLGLLGSARAALAGPMETQALRKDGKVVYETYCVGCHGEKGDGRGPAAEMLIVKPRDFTKGIYKFRSTPSGTLPTDQDLFKIISRGVYRTSMPEWSLLTERDRLGVIEYIKAFFPDWQKLGAGQPIHIPNAPASLGGKESVARGRQLFEMLDCARCHGDQGRGDGPSAKTLVPDEWGNPQKPFDFTQGQLKGGPDPEDVYRTFLTGINGTAMPSYYDVFANPDGESIQEGDAWHLVSYILSLRAPARPAAKAASAQQAPIVAPETAQIAAREEARP